LDAKRQDASHLQNHISWSTDELHLVFISLIVGSHIIMMPIYPMHTQANAVASHEAMSGISPHAQRSC
jgi:hypothetical protein